MTYRELSNIISKLEQQQMDCDVTISVNDEFYPASFEIVSNDDRLDDNHPIIVIKSTVQPKETHWFPFGQPIYPSSRVITACGKLVNYEMECDLRNPTCEICKQAKLEYDSYDPNFGDKIGSI